MHEEWLLDYELPAARALFEYVDRSVVGLSQFSSDCLLDVDMRRDSRYLSERPDAGIPKLPHVFLYFDHVSVHHLGFITVADVFDP